MVLATGENHLNFWTPLFADKAWVKGSWSGVGISSTSDSYSVIPSELLGDTNKVVVVAHYVVVTHYLMVAHYVMVRHLYWYYLFAHIVNRDRIHTAQLGFQCGH